MFLCSFHVLGMPGYLFGVSQRAPNFSGALELLVSNEIIGPRVRCRHPMLAWVRFN